MHKSLKMCKADWQIELKYKKMRIFEKFCGELWRIVGNFM